ncbi:MAG TPA: 4-hydroxythreonine-4-phosphate dehydrogenase PdxA [Bacteroidaceae bacterium]|nr:4-hydroxythreonine-4-phosphate dehydrogenase PdxA [Bacteroidaceae bacterium]
MIEEKIKIGITQGDFNGIGYEIILKTFQNQEMFDFCTPILYGSPKVAIYHRKAIESTTNFTLIDSAAAAQPDRLNMVNCNEEEVKVEFGLPTEESGKAAFNALSKAVEDYRKGYIEAIVTAPINKKTIQSDAFNFQGHTEYIEFELGEGKKALMILMSESLKIALVTVHEPISKISQLISKDLIKEKIQILNETLLKDFQIEIPRIAVLALNPHAGDDGLIGNEEKETIIPAIKEMVETGIHCFGPFSADGFFGSGNYRAFDAILAMYHDQGLIPLKTIAMNRGVNFTAGLPVIRTSPDHGTAFDIAGKGVASEESFREAIYSAIDIFRSRQNEENIRKNPLQKHFFARTDDSDKLKLDITDEG